MPIPKESKICVGCKQLLLKDFYYINKSRNSLKSRCKKCEVLRTKKYKHTPKYIYNQKLNSKKWRENNKDRYNLSQRKWKLKIKNIVYDYYGRECKCCGEKEIKFLCLDHINNDGYKRRNNGEPNGYNLYSMMIKSKFPNDFQVLCYNCNNGKKINNGICPHKSNS